MSKRRQELYCQYVADGMDEREAIEKAGYSTKGNGISIQLSRLQNNPAVQKRITELKAVSHNAENIDLPDDCNPEVLKNLSAIDFLRAVYRNPANKLGNRISAASIVLPYEEAKLAPKGKKEGAVDNAKQGTLRGRFATFSNQDIFESKILS